MSLETSGKGLAMVSTGAAKYSIRTRGINLWYGDLQPLKEIDVDIRAGCITGLIGASGCGKTTFLRCFNRINERYGNVTTTGEITVLGKNIYDADVSLGELRKAVGMVFQRPNPLPISIYDNILFGMQIHGRTRTLRRSERDAIVEQALSEVFLWQDVKDKLRKRATHLTLEQQQKLCIARLLPLKPRVILMDEPCSALDAAGTQRVESLIMSLREKFTVLIVTHNMSQTGPVSQECTYILHCKLVAHG